MEKNLSIAVLTRVIPSPWFAAPSAQGQSCIFPAVCCGAGSSKQSCAYSQNDFSCFWNRGDWVSVEWPTGFHDRGDGVSVEWPTCFHDTHFFLHWCNQTARLCSCLRNHSTFHAWLGRSPWVLWLASSRPSCHCWQLGTSSEVKGKVILAVSGSKAIRTTWRDHL